MKQGSIGPIWSEGCEIIRRIFVTVRDKNWQEVAPQQWDTKFDRASGTTSIAARHTSDLVDFAWRGELRVTGNGREIEFSFTGEVPKDMEICRLGLVVLHPVDWMVGSNVRVEDSKSNQSMTLPRDIAPQPIVDGVPGAITQPFSTLEIERPGVGKLNLRFEGDLFELEDQRNWGDASFKTYCTPLRLGFPRSVKAGTVIAHRVHVRFEPASAPSLFPMIGCRWPMSSSSDGPRWRHVQFPVQEAGDNLLEARSQTLLEIALQTKDPEQLRRELAPLSKHRHRLARVLVYSTTASIPTDADFQRLQLVLKEFPALSDVSILSATQGFFVEFNRAVPPSGSFSGIAFPLTATVHSDDVATIVDNVATIHDMVNTARKVQHASSISLSPLAFYHPRREPSHQFPAQLARAWLLASLIEATLAGVNSVTLAGDVITELARSSPAGIEPSLSSLVEFSGFEAHRLDAELPRGVHAIILKSPGNELSKLLAANLTSRTQLLPFSSGELALPAFGTGLVSLHQVNRT